MKLPACTKLRGSVFWFQIGVPVALQAYHRKRTIQETLSTTDRAIAAHMAQERAFHWKREFRLQANAGVLHAPRAAASATLSDISGWHRLFLKAVIVLERFDTLLQRLPWLQRLPCA